jgi:signal peptidase I
MPVEQLKCPAVKVLMRNEPLKTKLLRFWREEGRSLLLLAVALFAVRSSLADWNDVPTGSMKPTILEGDRVYVNKLAYDLKVPFSTWRIARWADPARGDIVVFFSPFDGKRLVKRVIGLPGDTIELRNEGLIINGQPVGYRSIAEERLRDVAPTDRTTHIFATEELPGRTHAVAAFPAVQAKRSFGPFTVPAGQYFMMGDNRDDSFDSRYWGTVGRNQIVGRATAVVLSFDHQNYWVPRWHRLFSGLGN